MYPYFLKRIERDKTTDQNFYKVTGPKVYYQMSIHNDGGCSISKYIISLPKHNTKKEFDDRYVFVKISEKEYNKFLSSVASTLGMFSENPTTNDEREKVESLLEVVLRDTEKLSAKIESLKSLTLNENKKPV